MKRLVLFFVYRVLELNWVVLYLLFGEWCYVNVFEGVCFVMGDDWKFKFCWSVYCRFFWKYFGLLMLF